MNEINLRIIFENKSKDINRNAEIEIDNKHSEIIAEFNKSGIELDEFNFRSWKMQDDMQVPAQVSFGNLGNKNTIYLLIRYLYRNLFKRNDEKLIKQAILDDLYIIDSLGMGHLIDDNPVSDTPGFTNVYRYDNRVINMRWLRYIYILSVILNKKLLLNDDIWLDIGSYYGGLQGLVKKYLPNIRIVMVDFSHQLCRSYIYLANIYPHAHHILPDDAMKINDFSQIPKGSIVYLPVESYDMINNVQFDLASNFFSFGEMRRGTFENYMKSRQFSNAGKIYLVNRFVSSPFFERTYDTDLTIVDYLNQIKNLSYIDVFPIHHYMQVKRRILSSFRHRNVSSSYFEIIGNNK
jgi:putative sugar O-methyltransferase